LEFGISSTINESTIFEIGINICLINKKIEIETDFDRVLLIFIEILPKKDQQVLGISLSMRCILHG